QPCRQRFPLIPFQDQAEMPHGHGLAVHAIDCCFFVRLHELRGNLMAEEIEIDPALRFASERATEDIDEESSRRFDVSAGKCQVKSRSHAVLRASRATRAAGSAHRAASLLAYPPRACSRTPSAPAAAGT